MENMLNIEFEEVCFPFNYAPNCLAQIHVDSYIQYYFLAGNQSNNTQTTLTKLTVVQGKKQLGTSGEQ